MNHGRVPYGLVVMKQHEGVSETQEIIVTICWLCQLLGLDTDSSMMMMMTTTTAATIIIIIITTTTTTTTTTMMMMMMMMMIIIMNTDA